MKKIVRAVGLVVAVMLVSAGVHAHRGVYCSAHYFGDGHDYHDDDFAVVTRGSCCH